MPFLTPRGSPKFEGAAFVIVSHIVAKDDRPRVQPDKSITQSKEPSEDNVVGAEEMDEEDAVVNRWELDTEARMAYDVNHPLWDTPCEMQPPNRHYEIYGPFSHIYDSEGDGTTSETESSIDLSIEAHVEAASGRRTRATLPIVFAADRDNIFSLSSSVLYQRRVWGIELPVVGVCVSSDSSVVRLCLSWLDANMLNEAGLVSHVFLPCSRLLKFRSPVFIPRWLLKTWRTLLWVRSISALWLELYHSPRLFWN